MNITVKVDDISLNTMVGDVMAFDEDGDHKVGEKTMAHLVAEMVTERVLTNRLMGRLTEQVSEIRAEMIRETVRPQIEKAIAEPVQKTTTYGEPVGEPVSLRELIVAEARKMVNEPADRYGRNPGTYLTQAVATEVKKAFAAEIASAVRAAREQVSTEIGQHVAAAVQAGLRSK